MNWNTETLDTVPKVFDRLKNPPTGTWYWRGQSRDYGGLTPSIDRCKLKGVPRDKKISLEASSIKTFRDSAGSSIALNLGFFSHPGEITALTIDLVTLAVLRHHDVPTRLLDWSRSPLVAAYFAARHNPDKDGEIWSFDEARYEEKAIKQWRDPAKWFDQFSQAAFNVDDVEDFFVCVTYLAGFGRQNAQHGLYSVTSKFDCDHADRIESLLADRSFHIRYVIPKALKPKLCDRLRHEYKIWDGSLYPDVAGAAKAAREVFGP
jgi:hypothetical protein